MQEKRPNPQGWRGAEIQVTIEGNWTTYRVSTILDNVLQMSGIYDARMILFLELLVQLAMSVRVIHLRLSKKMSGFASDVVLIK